MTGQTHSVKPLRRWYRRKRLLIPLFILGFLSVMMLGLSPATPLSPPPSARQVDDARSTFELVRGVAGNEEPTQIAVSWEAARNTGQLAARFAGVDRATIDRDGNQILIRASKDLRGGLWLNVRARIIPNSEGFPAIQGRIGRLPIPAWASRLTLLIAHWGLSKRGIETPTPEEMLHNLTTSPYGVFAVIKIPKDSRLIAVVNRARGSSIDSELTLASYCALAKAEQHAPSTDFAVHLNRAFDLTPGEVASASSNRARLVALAMLLVSRDLGKLAGDIGDKARECAAIRPPATLLGRNDLALHWTLSATMAAVFGGDLSQTMGTWKELADSGPNGSGFSFIDLAADRSGIYFGRLAADEREAVAIAKALASATEPDILPLKALALAEGLTEAQFTSRFGALDSRQYTQMVARVDAVLARSEP